MESWEGVEVGEWTSRLRLKHSEFHEVVGSTNDRGKALVLSGAPSPAVVVADRQTAGRGRQGRPWASDHAGGLWMSLTDAGGAFAPVLPLIAGMAVARGVEACLGSASEGALNLKWPNDVYARGRKLAGVLCEAVDGAVVVGIGVNVNQSAAELPSGGDVEPVSIRVLEGSAVGRGDVLREIVGAWRDLRARLDGSENFGDPARLPSDLVGELNRRSVVMGALVAVKGTVRHSTGRLGAVEDGAAQGGAIGEDGTLSIRTRGEFVQMIAGSVRVLEER